MKRTPEHRIQCFDILTEAKNTERFYTVTGAPIGRHEGIPDIVTLGARDFFLLGEPLSRGRRRTVTLLGNTLMLIQADCAFYVRHLEKAWKDEPIDEALEPASIPRCQIHVVEIQMTHSTSIPEMSSGEDAPQVPSQLPTWRECKMWTFPQDCELLSAQLY